MGRHTLGIIGGILVVVGILAAVAFAVVWGASTGPSSGYGPSGPGMMRRGPRSGPTTTAPGGSYASPGERIFLTGVGHAGPIPRQGGIGMMGAGGCANCHRPDGRGGRIAAMMGAGIDVPDIRYSTLTSPRTEGGETEAAWTDAEIATAVREGREPGGKSLEAFMPLWTMDDQDMADLIAYLKELG